MHTTFGRFYPAYTTFSRSFAKKEVTFVYQKLLLFIQAAGLALLEEYNSSYFGEMLRDWGMY